jgi:16S rRNA (cytosine967-C5)-methyltransferase
VRELRHLLGGATPAAAAALAARASLCLRAEEPQRLLTALRAAGFDAEPGGVDPDCILVERGDPSAMPGARDGAFAVQDQASVFVVRALAPSPGDRVADVCAAPGGKARFAATLVGPEGRVVAGDVHERRARLIRTGGGGAAPSLAVVVHDARLPPLATGAFDRVLVDAPCSGIGSARRRPELLWRVQKTALPELAARQLKIVTAAADLVRPGGRLVYAVCTFPRAETDAVVDELLGRRHELRPVEVEGPDGPASRHRLWPHRHGSDGMFVAAFERVG